MRFFSPLVTHTNIPNNIIICNRLHVYITEYTCSAVCVMWQGEQHNESSRRDIRSPVHTLRYAFPPPCRWINIVVVVFCIVFTLCSTLLLTDCCNESDRPTYDESCARLMIMRVMCPRYTFDSKMANNIYHMGANNTQHNVFVVVVPINHWSSCRFDRSLCIMCRMFTMKWPHDDDGTVIYWKEEASMVGYCLVGRRVKFSACFTLLVVWPLL